jgi:hypothetical protein
MNPFRERIGRRGGGRGRRGRRGRRSRRSGRSVRGEGINDRFERNGTRELTARIGIIVRQRRE